MAAADNSAHGTSTCSVAVSPNEVDSGADLTLKATVACTPSGDRRGQPLLILDHDGNLARQVELTEFDGETNATNEFIVKAPIKPGSYRWQAVSAADATGSKSDEETAAQFSFSVKPHDRHIAVWSVPPAIESGENFRIILGIKCSSECQASGWAVEIRDHKGAQQATATVAGKLWPGTTALYHTEVHLSAPETEGLFTWTVNAPAELLDIPHTACRAHFGVRVVPPANCVLTIVAVDRVSQIPLKGAKVVVHPYEALTDEHGMARVNIPEGKYRVFVSAKDYFPFRADGEAKANVTIAAELELDVGLSDADVWS